MKPSPERVRLIGWAAAIGILVSFAVAAVLSFYGSRMDPWLVFFLCPPSIGGMALDNARGISMWLGASMIVLGNAVWYALVFGFVAAVFTPE